MTHPRYLTKYFNAVLANVFQNFMLYLLVVKTWICENQRRKERS